MKRTTKYVAFDVHQATTVASVREVSGRVIARSVLPTDSGALTEFVRGMRGARHVTFEEGTQAQWLYELLAPLVDRVIVCNRRGAPRQGNKGDQVDADHLSEQLRRGALRAVYHGSADRATLKELTRTYRNLVEDATRVMLRLKALFRARGIATAGTAVYHPRSRARWLAQLLEGGARFRAEARSTPSSTSCGSSAPRRRRSWSRRRGGIRRGACCGPSRFWDRSGSPCCWPRCRRRGGFGPNDTCGPTRGWPW
ncbi:MAG TPA: transposase [Gemmatimonadales bacterium]|nr:transposase [Gemmatimonadales bacterium]